MQKRKKQDHPEINHCKTIKISRKQVSTRNRELFGLRLLPAGGDPIHSFTKGMDLRIRLQGQGEEISKEVYLDIMLSGLTKAPEF